MQLSKKISANVWKLIFFSQLKQRCFYCKICLFYILAMGSFSVLKKLAEIPSPNPNFCLCFNESLWMSCFAALVFCLRL